MAEVRVGPIRATRDTITSLPRVSAVRLWQGMRHYPTLYAGLILILLVALFGLVGAKFVDPEMARAGSAPLDLKPTAKYPLGTDTMGRDMLTVLILGTPLTLRVGLIAAPVGLGVGVIFGFVSGFYGGWIDNLLRGAADVLITVPGLVILIVIAISLPGAVDVNVQALVIASLAWMWPTRTIRSQVLTMRERAYISVAKLSGMSGPEIIFKEMLPNLLPYLAASFTVAVASAILASIGLDALGLGPQNQPTLGNTIYWALFYSAPFRGLWWWWAPPIVVLVLVFVGLYLVTAGLDELANPRLRRVVRQ